MYNSLRKASEDDLQVSLFYFFPWEKYDAILHLIMTMQTIDFLPIKHARYVGLGA